MDDTHRFSDAVIQWQRQFGRHHLPWQCRDPYRIWVSEIMLQQTQVDTVIGFFERFIDAFPTVHDLAAAEFDQVSACWSGLGYYARARNLHQTAKRIVENYEGRFPEDPAILESFPGIGRSTAAAISAFAFGHRAAILDGNVKRVFSRVFAVTEPIENKAATAFLWEKAEQLLPYEHIDAYTQGLMDLGASLCSRRDPKCLICPVASMCQAHQNGNPEQFPIKRQKQPKPERETVFLLIRLNGRILLEKRPEKGIWGNLWCFPEADIVNRHDDIQLQAWCNHHFNLTVRTTLRLSAVRHTFTHFHLTIWPIVILVDTMNEDRTDVAWFFHSDKERLGLPKPVIRLWDDAFAVLSSSA